MKYENVVPVNISPPGKCCRLGFPVEVGPGIVGTGRISTNCYDSRHIQSNGCANLCVKIN